MYQTYWQCVVAMGMEVVEAVVARVDAARLATVEAEAAVEAEGAAGQAVEAVEAVEALLLQRHLLRVASYLHHHQPRRARCQTWEAAQAARTAQAAGEAAAVEAAVEAAVQAVQAVDGGAMAAEAAAKE